MNQILALKLVTGEELIAEMLEETDSTITIKNPVAPFTQQNPTGELVLRFGPWFGIAEGPFVIEKSRILCFGDNVNQGMKNEYNKIFGAGIVLPSQQLITG